MTSLLNPERNPGDQLQVPPELGGLPALPSGARVMGVLARIAWRRLWNRIAVGAFFGRKKAAGESAGPRQATPGKRGSPVWLTLFLGASVLWLGVSLSYSFVQRLSDRLSPGTREAPSADVSDPSHLDQAADAPHADAPQQKADSDRPASTGALWPSPPDDRLMASAVGLVLMLWGLYTLTLLLSAGAQDLGKVEWDMEWLFTFPVSARTLFLARVVQNATVGQSMFWLVSTGYLTVVYGCAGYGWWTVPLALAATGYLALLNASLVLVVETWVQKRLAPGRRKNLQAVLGVVGLLFFLLFLAVNGNNTLDSVVLSVVQGLPSAAAANPFSLPVLLCERDWTPLGAGAAMALLGVALPFGAVRLAGWQVRDGLVAAPGAYQGSRGRPQAGAGRRAAWLSGVVGKELRLLARDRAFLVQTLVIPVLMVGFSFLTNWYSGTRPIQDAHHAAVLAFGVGSLVLVFGAFQVLTAEGNSLWLLYTFPRKLPSILLEKILVWCGFASLYALAVLGIAVLSGMSLDGEAWITGGFAAAGVVIFSFIAGALGILAANPLETVVQRRVRPDLVRLYLLLASSYAFALYSPSIWLMAVQAALSALLAWGLWQKVQDRVPYLLEPTEFPPRLTLAEGVIAAQAYLSVQGILLFMLGDALPSGTALLIATGVAGVVVATASLFILRKAPDILATTGLVAPRIGPRPTIWQAAAPGVLAGVLAGLFAVGYMVVVGRIDALQSWKEALAAVPSPREDLGWFAWVVLAAPLFEEFLFRGLIFQGMRRSIRPTFAVLGSAAVFAVIHPPFKVIPVFVLGVAAALSFQRSRLLWTPILTHGVYNAIVVIAARMM